MKIDYMKRVTFEDNSVTIHMPSTKITEITIVDNSCHNGEKTVFINFSNNCAMFLNRCIVEDNEIKTVLNDNGEPIKPMTIEFETSSKYKTEFGGEK